MWGGRKRRFLEEKPIDRMDPETTIIGAGASIEGDFAAPADAIVAGTVDGALQVAGRVHLLTGGLVRGSLGAAAAKIEGTIEGPVTVTGHLEIGAAARVIGNIEAGRLAIAEGALVRGSLRSEAPTHRFVEGRGQGSTEAPDQDEVETFAGADVEGDR